MRIEILPVTLHNNMKKIFDHFAIKEAIKRDEIL